MHKVRFVLIALASLFLAGCINYEQETYLNKNLSGRVELCFYVNVREGVKAAVKEAKADPKVEKLMTDFAEAAKIKFKVNVKEDDFLNMFNVGAIKKKDYRRIERNGAVYFYFTVEFDDIRKLYEGKKIVTVAEGPDNLVTYTEYFQPPEDKKKENEKDKDAKKDPGLFKGFKFKYVLHMPQDIVSANTDRIDKNTATWEFPLDSIANNKDFYITASMKK